MTYIQAVCSTAVGPSNSCSYMSSISKYSHWLGMVYFLFWQNEPLWYGYCLPTTILTCMTIPMQWVFPNQPLQTESNHSQVYSSSLQ